MPLLKFRRAAADVLRTDMEKSNRHLRFGAALTLLIALPASGGELRYAAPWHEAGWKVSVSREECRLSQEIPYYGNALFSRKAGRDLTFSVTVQRAATREAVAQIQSLPPEWIHTSAPLDLGEIPSARGGTPFTLHGDQARRMLAELEKGMSPTLTYRDWGDQRDRVVVSVSAINLHKSLTPFLNCLGGLLPADFGDVRNSLVDFGLASTTLDPADRERLTKVAEYVRADEAVKGIAISGHTDNLGRTRANTRLSQKRAEAVRDFLVQQGVAASRIQLKYHGEASPRASNRTDDGRSLNRRVEISLLR